MDRVMVTKSVSTLATAAPPRLGIRDAVATLRTESTHARVLGGSIIMLLGSAMVSLFNFGYNVVVARMLGPAAFGHVAAVGTLLMIVSAITLSFQLVGAKVIARSETDEDKAAAYSTLKRKSWLVGLLIGTGMVITSGWISEYLNLPSPWLVIILAIGLTIYIPLGTKRGGLQGTCRFSALSWNLILETAVKLIGALVLIEMKYGVYGAIAAVSLSELLAYFFPRVPAELKVPHEAGMRAHMREGLQAIVFFTGQVVINNVDILLVKHFFNDQQAGLYAAIALVGRVLYLACWSVVSAMFPVSAGANREDSNHAVLVVPLVIVLLVSLVFIIGLGAFPDSVLRATFGSSFQMSAGMSALLSLRAAATGTYSLAVVLMAYEMSRKIANTGWMQLAISGAIILGIQVFHSDLRQVVLVQLVLMVVLLMIVSIPFFKNHYRTNHSLLEEAA
jgi:O-antigen/teichoic acid export membrane protein